MTQTTHETETGAIHEAIAIMANNYGLGKSIDGTEWVVVKLADGTYIAMGISAIYPEGSSYDKRGFADFVDKIARKGAEVVTRIKRFACRPGTLRADQWKLEKAHIDALKAEYGA